jgi:hypothetical protein
MKTKTTKRVKSIITLADIIEECQSCGVIYNDQQAMLAFRDHNKTFFTAQILSNGNVKYVQIIGNETKPYTYKRKKS